MPSAQDYDAMLAGQYGRINRALPGAGTDDFVRALAYRGFRPRGAETILPSMVDDLPDH